MVEHNIQIAFNNTSTKLNNSMKIIFDVFTPRPHFIVVHCNEYRKVNPTDKEINELMELIIEFLTNNSEYDNNTILSFHKGKWYQKKIKYFHAHLCVPKKPYCKAVKTMITSESSKNLYSSSDDYLKQLDEYYLSGKIKYNQYRDACLSMSYLCLNDPVSYTVPLYKFNTSKFTLVYLASSPRIGIIANKLNINFKSLYDFMNHFYLAARKKLSKINHVYTNLGAHLCIYVSAKKKSTCQLIERTDKVLVNDINPIKLVRLVGYIQIDEELYLRWLPAIFQPIWLNQFQHTQHIVST